METFGTIVADPPWDYRRVASGGARGYSTGHQYESLTTDDLCDLPVGSLASPDSVLLMWTTWPFLPDALRVIDAWGFKYITGFPKVSVSAMGRLNYGVGYWFRGATEPLLVAKRPGGKSYRSNYLGLMGDIPQPDTQAPMDGMVAQQLRHSRKPEDLQGMAEELYPGPYLELFGRRARPGWTVLGNEAPGDGLDIRERLAVMTK